MNDLERDIDFFNRRLCSAVGIPSNRFLKGSMADEIRGESCDLWPAAKVHVDAMPWFKELRKQSVMHRSDRAYMREMQGPLVTHEKVPSEKVPSINFFKIRLIDKNWWDGNSEKWVPTLEEYKECCGIWVEEVDGTIDFSRIGVHDDPSDLDQCALTWYESRSDFDRDHVGYRKIEGMPQQILEEFFCFAEEKSLDWYHRPYLMPLRPKGE